MQSVQSPARNVNTKKIFRQDDLSVFKLSEFNRDISDHHLRNLKMSIAKKNRLSDHPILVTNDMTVIDGQHRLEAAKALGVPVWYTFSDDTTWGDLGELNALSKKWTSTDYLNYWCTEGKEHYLKLFHFWNQNQFLPIIIAARLCAGLSPEKTLGGNPTNRSSASQYGFRMGTYKTTAKGLRDAPAFAAQLKDFERYYDGWKRVAFIKTFYLIAFDDRYDHQRMMHQLETYGMAVKIIHALNVDDYLMQLSNAYNYNRKGVNRVSFG